MKKCKYCYEEIDERATICPHCRKSQKSSNLKIFFIGLLSTLLIGGLLAGLVLACIKNEILDIDLNNIKFENPFVKIGEKKLTCSKEKNNENGYKSTEKVEVIYKRGKVIKTNSVTIAEGDESIIDAQMEFSKLLVENFNKVDGFIVNIEKIGNDKIKTTYDINYEKINYDNLVEIFGKDNIDIDKYKENLTIEEYKKEQLDGYTCK